MLSAADDARPLREEELDAASAMLSRAFDDSPLWRYVEPEAPHRALVLRSLMRNWLWRCHRFGEVWGAADTRSAALWLPPGRLEMTEAERAQLPLEPDAVRAEARPRLDRALAGIGAVVGDAYDPPHWHLAILGVEPAHQRRGLGAAALRPILARSDAEGADAMTDTLRPGNVPYYERHGFAVVAHGAVAETPLHIWLMRRLPQA